VITKDAVHLPVPALIGARGTATSVIVMDHGTLTNPSEPGWVSMVANRIGGAKGLVFRAGFTADRPWRALRWRLGLRGADAALYVGEELEPWFSRAGSLAIRYFPSVPTDFVPGTPEERRLARAEFGLADDAVVVSSIGRLEGEKGLDLVIDAVDRARSVQPRMRVVIAGTGALEGWLSDEVARRGLGDIVQLPGRLDRAAVGRLQHASDVHIYAGTISCGISICLIEAMASAVAPVVSDVPRAQRDLVGDAGWVVPAANADALSTALCEAVCLPIDRLATIGGDARERLMHPPDPTLADTLRRLLAGHAPSPVEQAPAKRRPTSAAR
jgi:glycosyltransferase involved in cell wall biosynthesis